MSFGETLQRIRRLKGKTQRDLADAIGMDYSYLSRLENGRFDSQPTRETIVKLAEGLGCTEEERRELLSAAGRIDEQVEEVARLATSQRPDLAELFLAAADHPPDKIRKLVEELRAEMNSAGEKEKGPEGSRSPDS